MDNNSDKSEEAKSSQRRKILRRIRIKARKIDAKLAENPLMPKGYDPELLYVECGRCGAPVLWEPGRATRLLDHAGVDPLELDSSCMLVTDACPACGQPDEYSVRIFRVSSRPAHGLPPTHGHA